MVKLKVHNPPEIKLKSSGYMGEPTGEIEIFENGNWNVKPFAIAKVRVPQPSGQAPTITENGEYNIADYETVVANVPPDLIDKTITANGTYNASQDGADGYRQVDVNLQFEAKEVTPSTVQQTVTPTPHTEYQALSQVIVNPSPLETVTVMPTTQEQTVTPQSPNIGFSSVTIEGYTPPPPIEEKDVNFYDYDGTVLYSYTKAEFLALEAFPIAPTHENLTFQKWTFDTLQEAKTFVTANNKCDIGTIYYSTDGKTRMYLTIDSAEHLTDLSLYIKLRSGTLTVSVNGAVIATETETTNSNVDHVVPIPLTSEIYPFNCVLEISYEGTGYWILGQGSQTYNIFGWNTQQRNFLKRITIGDDCRIGNGAFYSCTSLNSVVIPNSVTSIGFYAFQFCALLNSVVIPSSVTDIGNSAFYNCTSLNSIIITSSVTLVLRDSAFYNCTSLNSVIIPSSVTSIGGSAFYNCTSLNSVIIPSSVTSIGASAFNGCTSLNSVVIPNSVTSIGASAFQNCASLNNVVIPNSVTSIGASAFQNCASLNNVVIPSSVTSIGGSAFRYCHTLMVLDMSDYTNPNSVPTLDNTSALSNTPSIQIIYVKNQEMLTAFTSATNWSTYASRFQIKGD